MGNKLKQLSDIFSRALNFIRPAVGWSFFLAVLGILLFVNLINPLIGLVFKRVNTGPLTDFLRAFIDCTRLKVNLALWDELVEEVKHLDGIQPAGRSEKELQEYQHASADTFLQTHGVDDPELRKRLIQAAVWQLKVNKWAKKAGLDVTNAAPKTSRIDVEATEKALREYQADGEALLRRSEQAATTIRNEELTTIPKFAITDKGASIDFVIRLLRSYGTVKSVEEEEERIVVTYVK